MSRVIVIYSCKECKFSKMAKTDAFVNNGEKKEFSVAECRLDNMITCSEETTPFRCPLPIPEDDNIEGSYRLAVKNFEED